MENFEQMNKCQIFTSFTAQRMVLFYFMDNVSQVGTYGLMQNKG